jgi:hypothetical protein
MEEHVRSFLRSVADALLADDAAALAGRLAPWLDGAALRAAIARQVEALVEASGAVAGPPAEITVDSNPCRFEDLASGLPPEVTKETFVQRACLTLVADEDSGIDAWMDLWLTVVAHDGGLRVGAFEVLDPD